MKPEEMVAESWYHWLYRFAVYLTKKIGALNDTIEELKSKGKDGKEMGDKHGVNEPAEKRCKFTQDKFKAFVEDDEILMSLMKELQSLKKHHIKMTDAVEMYEFEEKWKERVTPNSAATHGPLSFPISQSFYADQQLPPPEGSGYVQSVPDSQHFEDDVPVNWSAVMAAIPKASSPSASSTTPPNGSEAATTHNTQFEDSQVPTDTEDPI